MMTISRQVLDFLTEMPVVVVTVEKDRILDIRLASSDFVAALALMAKAGLTGGHSNGEDDSHEGGER